MVNEKPSEDKNCCCQDLQETEKKMQHTEAELRQEEQESTLAEQLACRLAEKTGEAEALFSRLQRLQADFENHRRRVRREQEDLVNYAAEKLIIELLPVLDNLERALEAAAKGGDLDTFINGVDMIYRQLSCVLAKEGLAAMESAGCPFNPETHHAVMQVETAVHADNTVIEELQKGYLLKEKVLRTAMVKVAKTK